MEALRLLSVAVPEEHLAAVPGLLAEIAASRAELTRAAIAPSSLEAAVRYEWIMAVVGRTVARTAARAGT
jgi:hypothetical protein